jgi:putative NADPH-quinone reductase
MRPIMPAPVLLVTLHPDAASFNTALADAYAAGAASAGHALLRHDLAAMQFDPDFGFASYRGAKPLEPDLERFAADLLAARHLVLVAPMWWGGLPAKAKGLFDRVLVPGFAFDPRKRRFGMPKPLLTGRTARLVLTSDTPGWYFGLAYRSALRRQVEGQILRFCGIRPTGFTHLSPVQDSTPERRAAWLGAMGALGRQAA